jgi:hypothetical protein
MVPVTGNDEGLTEANALLWRMPKIRDSLRSERVDEQISMSLPNGASSSPTFPSKPIVLRLTLRGGGVVSFHADMPDEMHSLDNNFLPAKTRIVIGNTSIMVRESLTSILNSMGYKAVTP